MRKINQIFNFIEKNLSAVHLTDEKEQQLSLFVDLLLKWNSKINLTAIRDEDTSYIRHILEIILFVESSFIQEKLRSFEKINVIDIGSGGGIPAIPLQIIFPEYNVISVEKVKKKAAFQSYVKSMLNLDRLQVEAKRIEELAIKEKCQVVTARAFSSLSVLCEKADLVLQKGGYVIAWKSKAWREEYKEIKKETFAKFLLIHVEEYVIKEYNLQGVILLLKKEK